MSDSETNGKKNWVQFEDDKSGKDDQDSPAVLHTQPIQVTLDTSRSEPSSPVKPFPRSTSEPANGSLHTAISLPTEPSSVSLSPLNPAQLQTVPLSDATATQNTRQTIREGFANGDVIVTILPQNSALPWITPAKFRPELVPEELMAQGLTLTVEDYVHVMSQLVNDHRFTVYNICYKRILMVWISLAFVILLGILFAHLKQYVMFGAGIVWLMVNASAIFFCMWIKIKLNKSLERCVARINLQLMKHKLLLGVDDRGKISCHKINLCFIYFDPNDCVRKLENLMGDDSNWASSTDFETAPDVVITGATNTPVTAKRQDRALGIFANYSQRWAKLCVRGMLTLGTDRLGSAVSSATPRHASTRRCPCQYIEDHLKYKPQGGKCRFCTDMAEYLPNFGT